MIDKLDKSAYHYYRLYIYIYIVLSQLTLTQQARSPVGPFYLFCQWFVFTGLKIVI